MGMQQGVKLGITGGIACATRGNPEFAGESCNRNGCIEYLTIASFHSNLHWLHQALSDFPDCPWNI